MRKIRVLVVEDSATVREHLIEVLNADPELEVIGFADNGRGAIELCESLKPDVITLDMMLPVMSGLAATEYIMAHRPTPILIVSSSTNRGELFKIYDALAAGAVDVLEKPNSSDVNHDWETQFRAAVKIVSRIRVITHPRGRLISMGAGPRPPGRSELAAYGQDVQVVAIGASTGGPAAVLEVLQGLPENFPLPILVVVHIGKAFGTGLADWLGSQCPRPVRMAQDDEPLPSFGERQVLVAPADRHLIVRAGRVRLTSETERNFCRPSVDVLFESVARECGEQSIACLLTGMGRDGAEGLLAVRQAGGRTVAQDEATSIVFGMPREAARLLAAEQVLPLTDIALALVTLAHGSSTRRVR